MDILIVKAPETEAFQEDLEALLGKHIAPTRVYNCPKIAQAQTGSAPDPATLNRIRSYASSAENYLLDNPNLAAAGAYLEAAVDTLHSLLDTQD